MTNEEIAEQGMIDVTDHDHVKMVQLAYDLSVPRGLGFFQADRESLSEDDARAQINLDKDTDRGWPINIDYLKGRAVKFRVRRANNDRWYVRPHWYDHTPSDLSTLLSQSKRVPVAAGELVERVE